jgi:hypothetical protein
VTDTPSMFSCSVRASLGTPFSQGIYIFLREISSFSLGKIEISWENRVPKLALKDNLVTKGITGGLEGIEGEMNYFFLSIHSNSPVIPGHQISPKISTKGVFECARANS